MHEPEVGLVEAARDGDHAAWGHLLARHYPLLRALCARQLGDAALAEDAAQEAALLAFLGLARLRRPDRFGPWLAGIGLNVCRRWQRHRAREAWSWEALSDGQPWHEPADRDPGPEERALDADVAAQIRAAITALPTGQQESVRLVYLAERTPGEAARALGIGPGALKTRLFKGRRTLRRRLTALWEEERMATTPDDSVWIDMAIEDIRRQPGDTAAAPPRYALILRERGGTRRSIWGIGPVEAEVLATQLHGVALPRPLPYALMTDLVAASGGRVTEVRVAIAAGRMGYATVLLDGPAGPRTVDARVGDALNLALATAAPIRLAATLLRDDDPAHRDRVLADLHGPATAGGAAIAGELAARYLPPPVTGTTGSA